MTISQKLLLGIIILFGSMLYTMTGIFIDRILPKGELTDGRAIVIAFWPIVLILFLIFWLLNLPIKLADKILERRNKK